MIRYLVTPVLFLNTPRRKLSSARAERYMHAPLPDVLNLGLEVLSKIEVDGLLKFQNRITFVRFDEGVTSEHDPGGSLLKPDVVHMPLPPSITSPGSRTREV